MQAEPGVGQGRGQADADAAVLILVTDSADGGAAGSNTSPSSTVMAAIWATSSRTEYRSA